MPKDSGLDEAIAQRIQELRDSTKGGAVIFGLIFLFFIFSWIGNAQLVAQIVKDFPVLVAIALLIGPVIVGASWIGMHRLTRRVTGKPDELESEAAERASKVADRAVQLIHDKQISSLLALQKAGGAKLQSELEIVRACDLMVQHGINHPFRWEKDHAGSVGDFIDGPSFWLTVLKAACEKTPVQELTNQFELSNFILNEFGTREIPLMLEPPTQARGQSIDRVLIEENGVTTYNFAPLDRLLGVISRRTKDAQEAVSQGGSMEEIHQWFIEASNAKGDGKIRVRSFPKIDEALIGRCVALDEFIPWTDIAKLAEACKKLNWHIDRYMQYPRFMDVDMLLHAGNEVLKLTDADIRAQWRDKVG